MIHFNIRSAPKNLDSAEMYLSNLDHTFSIIALSENWLKLHNKDLFNMDGYQSEHRIRPIKNGGGVSLLVKNNIEYFVREDMCLQNDNIESLFIEIDKSFIGKNQDAVVGILYRPPDTDIKSI